MRNKRIQNARTVEEEIRWLNDLGLSAAEKISILELMISSSPPEDRELMREACEAIAVESILLGNEDL